MVQKIRYVSVRCYVQKDGVSWRAVASIERDPSAEVGADAPAAVTAEFGEVKFDPAEAIADALDRAGFGGGS